MHLLAPVTPRIVSSGTAAAVPIRSRPYPVPGAVGTARHGQHPQDDRDEPVFREAEGKGRLDPKSFSRSIAPGRWCLVCFCGAFLRRLGTPCRSPGFTDFIDSAIRGFLIWRSFSYKCENNCNVRPFYTPSPSMICALVRLFHSALS